MRKIFLLMPLLCGTALAALPAAAQNAQPGAIAQTAFDQKLADIAGTWDRIKYQMPYKDAQIKALDALETEADSLSASFPDRAEPKIWEGIAYATESGLVGGMKALPKVKKARALFEAAIAIDGDAMNGGAHTSLGSLYYLVPGWPIAFGDDSMAEKELKTALAINPNDIDANYFYGDYLVHRKKYADAVPVLEHAEQAPPRPGRGVGDAGRRQEIQADLTKAQKAQAKGDED